MKANDFVKLVFGYFADNPDAGLDFIEHIENRAELAASVQEDGNVWDNRNVVKADIIQHCAMLRGALCCGQQCTCNLNALAKRCVDSFEVRDTYG